MKDYRNVDFYLIYCAIFISSVFFLLAASGVPIFAIVKAGHDDGLFFRGLDNILNGNWLGDYDNLTLAKGPMLSIVGAMSAAVGIQAKFTEAVIYLGAGGMVFLMSWRIGLPRTVAAGLFILILCNPHLWSQPGRRYLRDILYPTWAIFMVVFAMGCLTAPNARAQNWSAVGVGFFAGCAYLTREEDIWIIAILATFFGVAAFVSLFRHGIARIFAGWRFKIRMVLIGGGAMAAIVSPVVLSNYAAYGVAVVSEFRTPEFRAAIGALMRVGEIHPSGYVPVPQSALQSVFQIAPVTKGMRDYWPKLSEGWARPGANLIPVYPKEIAGGWFTWAFRDLVAATGHYATASAARDFYAELAKEVNEACDIGKLTCRPRRDTLAPELTAMRMDDLIGQFWNSLIYTALIESDGVNAARSEGATSELLRWNALIGPVVVDMQSANAFPDTIFLSGWVASTIGPISITTVADSPGKIQKLSTMPGPDVIKHFKDNGKTGVDALRFSMWIECPAKRCDFAVTAKNGDRQTISLTAPVVGAIHVSAKLTVYLDVVQQNSTPVLNGRLLEGIAVPVASFAAKLAQKVVPILSLTATMGILLYFASFKHHQQSDWLFILATASAASVVMRCFIIAYIDITSWRAINTGYLGPCYPFMIIYSVTGTAILARIVDDLRHRGRRSHEVV
jgi:hypothetical protein